MRIAISKLLGYQLAFLDSGRIRVTSVHAPSKDRSLAFDPSPEGPMPFKLVSAADESVMRNDQVRQSIAFWLDERKSLSGFMASLTSEFSALYIPIVAEEERKLILRGSNSDFVRRIDERWSRLWMIPRVFGNNRMIDTRGVSSPKL